MRIYTHIHFPFAKPSESVFHTSILQREPPPNTLTMPKEININSKILPYQLPAKCPSVTCFSSDTDPYHSSHTAFWLWDLSLQSPPVTNMEFKPVVL